MPMAVNSLSKPFSSPSEDDRSELQDTVAMDSPLAEASLDNLDFDTEPVDDSNWVLRYEEEVVLDSEDEGINARRPMSITDNESGKGVNGCGLDFQLRKLPNQSVTNSHASAWDQSCQGNGISADELEERVDLKSIDKHSEANAVGMGTFEMYDIGFDTQMAAEAIQVLACGNNTAGCSPANAYKGVGSTVSNSVRGVTKEKEHSESHSPQNNACYDIGEIPKSIKRKKRSARNFSRGSSSIPAKKQSRFQESDSELAPKMQGKGFKYSGETQLCCINSANESESLGRRPPKPKIEQRNAESPTPSMPPSRGQFQGHLVTVSLTTHQSRHSGLRGRLTRSDGQSFDQGERVTDVMDHGMLVYRRRHSRLVSDPYKISSAGGKCCELDYSGEEAQKSILTNHSNLDNIWKYTRRKRTRHTIPNHPSGTNKLNGLSRLVDGKDVKLPYQERMRNSGDMKGIEESLSSTSSCAPWNSSENDSNGSLLGQNFDKPSSSGLIIYARAKKCMRVSPMVPALHQASIMQSEKNSRSAAGGVECKYASIAVSNKTLELSGSECNTTFNSESGKNVESSSFIGYNYHKKLCNRNVPKSSLLRELVRLVVPESIPVVPWKVLRRRKEMAHVRILFSQHLEDDIIKQQKKIVSRLGISIASNSVDATHFVANKFVRTRNMLEAIALGKPVVTQLWLESCAQASCFIDEKDYILRDAKKEKEFSFSMPVSLSRAKQHPLLQGQRVFITPNIKPDKETITNLVKAVHGEPVEKFQISNIKNKENPDGLFILSCIDDEAICLRFVENGASVYSSELLLNGIVCQKLEYKRYQLFTKDARRNCL